MSETRRTAKASVSKAIRHEYAIKAGDIKRKVQVWSDGTNVYLKVSGRPLSLMHFNPRQRKDGTSVRVRKDMGRKVIRGAFMAKGNNGNTLVFKRALKYDPAAGKEMKRQMRRKLKKLVTLSVADMTHEDNIRQVIDDVRGKFVERLQRNFDFYISRAK